MSPHSIQRCAARVILFVLLILITREPTSAAAPPDEDPAYTRTITERAEKVIAPLELSDAGQRMRVREAIVDQYRHLSRLHDDLDAKIASAKQRPGDPAVAEAYVKTVENQANLELFARHRAFVAQLAAELSPEQVDQVKDGMTYGVVPLTFRVYQEMLPDLTAEQKARIHGWLIEAREYAMDAGSSEKKHWWFGKYKGRINNYLSSAGYDLKQAEKDLAEKRKRATSE